MSQGNLPLHRLFTALQAADLFIGPAERLRVQQLLADSPSVWQTAEGRAALMYELAPLLCRNRVEQEAFYKAYETFLGELAAPIIPEKELEKPTFGKKYGKTIVWMLGLLAALAAGWWALQNWQPKEKIHVTFGLKPGSKIMFAPGDTVVFANTTRVNNPAAVQFEWTIKETDQPEQTTVFRDTTSTLRYIAPMPSNGKRAIFEAILQAKDQQSGEIYPKESTTFGVVFPCVNPPTVQGSISVTGALRTGQKIKFFAPKGIKKHWRIYWDFGERDFSKKGSALDDSEILNPENVFNDPGRHTVELTITDPTQPGYCTTTLTKEILIEEDIPTLAALPLYKDAVKPLWAYTWLIKLLALLAFALATWFAWRWWRRPGITIMPPAPNIPEALRRAFEAEPQDKTPYSIPYRSNNSQIRIAAEQIELANTFRRRQEGQVAMLNIPRSIQATMEKLGYAELRFSYNTRPTHYLFLIDLQNEVSHQAQLFRYLVEMLEGQDVLADVFFYKNSLARCWNKLHPEGLSLDQLALQYADRRLVVFGDGYRLLSEADEGQALHKDQSEALRRWPQRMLLTPATVAAWTYREARLYQLWAVFQADLGGLMQAARFVEAGMDDENLPPTFAEWKRQCQRSPIDADTDRDWDRPAEHRDYLREAGDRDGALYRWLRALSVYPELNWNVTIAIGRALGIEVRYEHLLVLARIPWLQAGAMKPALWRAWMREMPLPDAAPDETLAREAVRTELRAVEALCAEGYADQKMQTRLAVQDFALAPADRDAQDRLYYILQHIAPAPLLTEELDRTVARNIPDFQWTSDQKPGRAMAYLQAGQPQPTVQRPFWTRDMLWCMLCLPFCLLLLVAPERWAALYERYPTAMGLFVAPQEDEAVRWNNLAVEASRDSVFDQKNYSEATQTNLFPFVQESVEGDLLGLALDQNREYKLAMANYARVFYNVGLRCMEDEKFKNFSTLYLREAYNFSDSLRTPAAEALSLAFYKNNQSDSACYWMQQVLVLKPDYRNWLAEKGACQKTACRQVINVSVGVAMRNRSMDQKEFDRLEQNADPNLEQSTYILNIPLGATLDLLDSTALSWKVSYSGKIGFISKFFKNKPVLGVCSVIKNLLDSDKDGIVDSLDSCPNIAGTIRNKGCPDESVQSPKTNAPDSLNSPKKIVVLPANENFLSFQLNELLLTTLFDAKCNIDILDRGNFQFMPLDKLRKLPGIDYIIIHDLQDTAKTDNYTFFLRIVDAHTAKMISATTISGNKKSAIGVNQTVEQFFNNERSQIKKFLLYSDFCRIENEKRILEFQTIESEMVFIKGGTFRMGSDDKDEDAENDEKPDHYVTLSAFSMGRTEVTNKQYLIFCDETKGNYPEWLEEGSKYHIVTGTDNYYKEKGMSRENKNHPVTGVSWNDAVAYCKWLSKKTGKNYRLPTEAEWEYAARGGTKWTDRYIYAGSNTVDEVAWYIGNSKSRTHPVVGLKPNQLGLYDMSGNVWEWCSDWYADYKPVAQQNPVGPDKGEFRVLRGGGWERDAEGCRSASRSGTPTKGSSYIGFRLVLQ